MHSLHSLLLRYVNWHSCPRLKYSDWEIALFAAFNLCHISDLRFQTLRELWRLKSIGRRINNLRNFLFPQYFFSFSENVATKFCISYVTNCPQMLLSNFGKQSKPVILLFFSQDFWLNQRNKSLRRKMCPTFVFKSGHQLHALKFSRKIWSQFSQVKITAWNRSHFIHH